MTGALLRIYAVLSKEFTQLSRDRITYAMILMMPLVQLLLFGYAINTDPRHLPAAVFSSDHSAMADSVIAAMERTSYVDVRYLPRSESEMDDLLRRGQVMLGLTIPPDFTERVLRGDKAQVLTPRNLLNILNQSAPLASTRQEFTNSVPAGMSATGARAPSLNVLPRQAYTLDSETAHM